MSKTMAEVLYQEGAWCGVCEYEGWDACPECRSTCEGYAKALSAAGFGLVADAGAKALREAAEASFDGLHSEPVHEWLYARARAAAVRGES